MPFNINTESISQSLFELTHPDNRDEAHSRHVYVNLMHALKRPLIRRLANQSHPEDLYLIKNPVYHPKWVKEAMDRGEQIYDFNPRDAVRDAITHVADWISAAIINQEPWLQNCDDHGRPLKLIKIGSLEQAVAEADKAMRRALAQSAAALASEDFKTIKTFPDGAQIIHLLTPNALDAESRAMRHCVGLGAYDDKLASGAFHYYSLRVPSGKTAATLEVAVKTNTLLQCKGRNNKPPVSKYMPYIQRFVQERNFSLKEIPYYTGLIKADGRYYDIRNLPDGFTYQGDLNLSHADIETFPENATIHGILDLRYSRIRSLGKNLTAANLHVAFTAIQSLPSGLKLDVLDAEHSPITALPNDISIKTACWLSRSKIRQIPDNFTCGKLSLLRTKIKQLPPGLRVERLHIEDTRITDIPPDANITDTIYYNRPLQIPATAIVGNLDPRHLYAEGLEPRRALAERVHPSDPIDHDVEDEIAF